MKRVLITGATGYVGGRLVHRLENEPGLEIRCLARSPQNIRLSPASTVACVQGDLSDAATLGKAFEGIDTAYFLAHALGAVSGFEEMERSMARNFAAAAARAKVAKIIYLGGLGKGPDLSPHLATRHEVGAILRQSGITVVEFQASIIVGSGSLSFELVRSLTEKLPFMITPRWVYARAQPIAIRDVLHYLVAALHREFKSSEIIEIGGPTQVAYSDLIRIYARLRGLSRILIPVPLLTPRLSSLWLGLVTPVYARVGRKLIDGLKNDSIVTNRHAMDVFPEIHPIGIEDAMRLALEKEDQHLAETRWCDAVSSAKGATNYGGLRFGSRIVDSRTIAVDLPPEQVFIPIQRIGGESGWYYANVLWRIRGMIDLLCGGVGMRRGRVHPFNVSIGDTLDFWRVEDFKPHRLLRLKAEMRLPGRAWLQFEVQHETKNGSKLTQTAIFDPLGIMGLLYWYALYPIHTIIFRGMLRNIVNRARQIEQRPHSKVSE